MFDFGKRNIINMNYTRYLALPKVWVDATPGVFIFPTY